MKKFFLLFAAACCAMLANAERVKVDDLYYEIDKDAQTAIVTYETLSTDGSNYSSLTSVTIYITIQVGGETYTIIGIGEKAFHSNNTISQVTIGYNYYFKTIGAYAFNNATALEFVSIKSPALESIGDHAFYGCSALTGIDLPSPVKTIDQYAFCNCKAMSKVMIPEGTTTIGTCAFRWCEGLEYLRLPSTLTSIGDFAFQNCKALKEMHCHLAAPLDLGTNAQITFANAPETAKVYVGGNPETFRNAAGWSVLPISDEQLVTSNDLYYIINPSDNTATLTWDHYSSFYFNYYDIEGAVTLPSTITEGGKSYTVTAIAPYALKYLNMTELIIPDEVTTIGEYAIANNFKLTTIHLPANLKVISEFMCYQSAIEEIVIPESVETIESNAFYGCDKLTKVTLPAGLKEIGFQAFMRCKALQTVTNYNPTPLTIPENTFYDVPCESVKLFVPKGSGLSYAKAAVWKQFDVEEFEPQGIDTPSLQGRSGEASKVIRNGQLLIEKNGKTYNAQGAEMK